MALKTALYTTIYPGEEPYIKPWYDSVQNQTCRDFEIVIGLDEFTPEQVFDCVGFSFKAHFIPADKGASPAQVREKAFRFINKNYDRVVFTDSDDILHPERIERASRLLDSCDITACSLRIIDTDGTDLKRIFPLEEQPNLFKLMPRANVFGLSNTAYKTSLLEKVMPFPAECVMLDWFMATRAWLYGAEIKTDTKALMDYRQHHANTARVLPPFTKSQLLRACELLKLHYELIEIHVLPDFPQVKPTYAKQISRLETFIDAMSHAERLEEYLSALNKQEENYIWWSWIAHPALEEIWKN